jgi:tetratricopeptide (TPR) repeat protein
VTLPENHTGDISNSANEISIAGARELFADRRYQDCILALRQLLCAIPESSEAWIFTGGSHALLKRHGDAVTAFRRVVVLAPQEIRHLKLYRDATHGLGWLGHCVMLCRRVLVSEPDDKNSLKLLARIHADRDQMHVSIRTLQRLQRLAPLSAPIATALARGHLTINQLQTADAWCRRSLLLDGMVAERWFDMARIRRARDDLDTSQLMIRRAVILDRSFELYARVLDLTVRPENFTNWVAKITRDLQTDKAS